jgi:hypothetical protein
MLWLSLTKMLDAWRRVSERARFALILPSSTTFKALGVGASMHRRRHAWKLLGS